MKIKISEYVCLESTSDAQNYYERVKVYKLPADHPCIEYFKLADLVEDPLNPGDPPTAGRPA